MNQVSTAEKIETTVLSYLRTRRVHGAMGCLVENEPNHYTVTCDGVTVKVSCGVIGWHVRRNGFVAIDRALVDAAAMVLNP